MIIFQIGSKIRHVLTNGDMMKKRCSFFFYFLFLLIVLSACTPAKSPPISTRNIYYAGGDNQVKDTLLKIGYGLVDDINDADVFVLNDEIHSPYVIQSIMRNKGRGLILIPGEHIMYYGVEMDVQALIGQTVGDLIPSDNPVDLSVDDFFARDDPLVTEIDWTSAPQVLERAFLIGPGPGTPLIRREGYVETVLYKLSNNEFYLSVYLDEQHNLAFQEWEYFDYLMYHLVERSAGAEPLSFTEFSAVFR